MNKNDKNDKNKTPNEPFSVVPGMKPFTKYRTIELAVCGIAVILGLLYLYADVLSLAVLLPLYCAVFAAVTVLRYLDAKALGLRGFASMLPIICWAVLTCAVIVATGAYFAG